MSIQRVSFSARLLIALLASRTSGQTTFATLTRIVTDRVGHYAPGAHRHEYPQTPELVESGTNIGSLAQVGVISGVGDVSDLDPSGRRSFRIGLRLGW
jgi:hypothetical protein